jgi:hypothetical protein
MLSPITPARAAARSWAMTAASLRGPGAANRQHPDHALAVVARRRRLVVFVAVVFAVGVLDQRKPPYPI